MLRLLGHLLMDSVAFMIIANLLPGFKIKTPSTAVSMAVVYGLLMGIATKCVGLFLGLAFMISLLAGPLAPFAWLFILAIHFVVGFLLSVALLIVTDKLLEDFQMDNTAVAVVAAVMLVVIHVVFRKLL